MNTPVAKAADTPILVRRLGRVDYAPTFQAMQDFTAARTDDTADELWLVEHGILRAQVSHHIYTIGCSSV